MEPHPGIWDECLETAALSDIGLRRGNNQDALAVVLAGSQEIFEQRGHLFLVADGMGAHAAGELASKLASDVVLLTYSKLLDRQPAEALSAAVQDANLQIHTRGNASDDFRGMGTTVSVLVLLPQGALVAHVGDSRVYRLRGTRLEQLTFDHSLVWELRAAGHVAAEDYSSYIPKNIITRSLGPNPDVPVDLEGFFPIRPGDSYLLCSDGLSGQVKDEEIGKVLLALPPKDAVQALVDLANLRGGPDNITVIAARVTGPLVARGATAASAAERSATASRLPPVLWAPMGILAVAAAVLAALGHGLLAAACLVGAAVAGVVALLRGYGRVRLPFREGTLGRGPHRSVDCTVDAGFVAQLAQIAQQLHDAASSAEWSIDWERFRSLRDRAEAAGRSGELLAAVREYCGAVTFMMAELRSQRDRIPPGGGGPAGIETNW